MYKPNMKLGNISWRVTDKCGLGALVPYRVAWTRLTRLVDLLVDAAVFNFEALPSGERKCQTTSLEQQLLLSDSPA